jgi:hypothetical protein
MRVIVCGTDCVVRDVRSLDYSKTRVINWRFVDGPHGPLVCASLVGG